MKKLLLFVAVAVVLSSCGNNKETAQMLIDEELSHTLSDYKSYHPISFGSLDSLFSSYKSDSGYVDLARKAEYYHNLFVNGTGDAILSQTSKQQEALQDKVKQYEDSAALLKTQADIYAKSFKGKYIGWKMSHTFKTPSQGTVTYRFFFDPRLTKVVGSEKE
ncbi:MAG: hypothetical protein H6Q17_2353 [Bacteroidetes bacterium]|nr:hypothetical protein [Bacteroidota bacterium]